METYDQTNTQVPHIYEYAWVFKYNSTQTVSLLLYLMFQHY